MKMKTGWFSPSARISEKDLAKLLVKEPWVKDAKWIQYIDPGDCNEDIEVSYILLTPKWRKPLKIYLSMGAFHVGETDENIIKKITEFFKKIGYSPT